MFLLQPTFSISCAIFRLNLIWSCIISCWFFLSENVFRLGCALYAQYSEVMPSPTLLDAVIAWIPSCCLWYLRNYTSVHLLSAGLVPWIWRCDCWCFSAMIYSQIPCLCIVWTKFIYVLPYYGIEHWNVSNRGKYTDSYCGGKLFSN